MSGTFIVHIEHITAVIAVGKSQDQNKLLINEPRVKRT